MRSWVNCTSVVTVIATMFAASIVQGQDRKHNEDASTLSIARLQKQIDEQGAKIQQLEQQMNMSATITAGAGAGVGLVVGEYVWTDPAGKRALRYQGFSKSGEPLRDQNGSELVGFDGSGPPVVRQFQGSAFAVDSKHILTSGYILAPWSSDPLLDESENPEVVPEMTTLHVYFPGVKTALDVEINGATEDGDDHQ